MRPCNFIPLSQGRFAIVSAEDYPRLMAMGQWTLHSQGYAYRWDRSVKPAKCLMMHRVVASTPAGLDTDHINGNKLDNRRFNLRPATRSLNNMNRPTRGGFIQARGRSYSIEVVVNRKKLWIGRIPTEEEADHIREDIKQQLMEVI